MKPGRSAAWLTGAAAALVLAVHLLPSRVRLTPADFVAGGPQALEFCDPANPKFLPVLRRTSPVLLMVRTSALPRAGSEWQGRLRLGTAGGKPIGPADLAPVAGAAVWLYLADPGLEDLHEISARPGAEAGEWRLSFTPRRAGAYRIFADFEPKAIEREVYATCDLKVEAGPAPIAIAAAASAIAVSPTPVYARQPVSISLPPSAARLIALDQARSGLLTLTPAAGGTLTASFGDPGRYYLWSWGQSSGQDLGAGQRVDVLP